MRLRSLLTLLLAICCCILTVRFMVSYGGSFQTAPDVPWAAPSELALNNIGPADPDHLLRSYDCTSLTYRLIDDRSKTMQTGCFVETAFGRIDPTQSVAIFNSSDEAERIELSGQPAPLSVPPYSGSIGQFGGFPGAGSYLYFYNDFYGALQTEGIPLVNRHKSIAQTPNRVLTAPDGTALSINPQAFAYGPRSQWIVTEVPGHSLVRISMSSYDIVPFGDAFDPPERAFGLKQADMAISDDGRYVAVASAYFRSFRVYDLKQCGLADSQDALKPQQCRSYDYWPYIAKQVSGELQRISHIAFSTDNVLSFDVRTTSETTTYRLSPNGPITSLIPYLGLGDSFASGQGAFNYLSGTDTPKNRCHLAAASYPLLLSGDLFASQGHSVACSGARTHDVGSTSPDYAGQSSDQLTAKQQEANGNEVSIIHDFKPGYLAQQQFVTNYQPGVITVQVGGNDVGFGSILFNCLSPLASASPPKANTNSCYQTHEDRLEYAQTVDRNYGKWVSLYKQLHQQSPGSTIYVIGYPQILSSKADCRLNTPLTLAEISFAREATLYLNTVLQRAAKAAGVTYVSIADALAGHELCSGASGTLAVNGLTAGNDAYGLGQESFHPTAYGHELIEQAILQATKRLTGKNSQPVAQANPAVAPSDSVVQAPVSGRAVRLVNYQTITSSVTARGEPLTLSIPSSSGLLPSTNYQVVIGQTTVATTTTTASGGITITVSIPGNLPPGQQNVTVQGPGQGSQPVVITQPIYIPTSPTDTDGDGIPNTSDSCPFVPNSGIDNNKNGVDDVCDNQDPTPPNPPVAPPTSTPSTPVSQDDHTSLQTTTPAQQTTSPVLDSAPLAALEDTQFLMVIVQANMPVAKRVITYKPAVNIRKLPISKLNPAVLGIQTSAKQARPKQSAYKLRKPLKIFYWYVWALIAAVCYLCWLCTHRHKDAAKAVGRARNCQ